MFAFTGHTSFGTLLPYILLAVVIVGLNIAYVVRRRKH
jgi:hypothetical protein